MNAGRNPGTSNPGATNPGAPSVERFFQYSLLGLVVCAFCALADTGRLDLASLAFLLAGVLWRGLMVAGLVRMRIPQRLITILATSYLVFYPIDFYFLLRCSAPASAPLPSRNLLSALTGNFRRNSQARPSVSTAPPRP